MDQHWDHGDWIHRKSLLLLFLKLALRKIL